MCASWDSGPLLSWGEGLRNPWTGRKPGSLCREWRGSGGEPRARIQLPSPSTKTVHGAGRAGCPVKGFKQEKDLKANRPQVEPPQNLPKRTADPSPRSRASGTRNVSPGRQTHRCRRRGCGNFSVSRLPVLGLWTEKLRFQPEKPKITVANKTFPQH